MPNVSQRTTRGTTPRPKSQPSSTKRRRKAGKSGGSAGVATPGSVAVNFHGSFAATSKVISAKDLGIPVGSAIFVHSVHLEYSANTATIIAVSIADLAMKGATDVDGPRSPSHLAVELAKSVLNFKNPNPRFYFVVAEDTDVIMTLYSSNVNAALTFSGTVRIGIQGSPSHVVS